jgi:hypothetical protein
MPKKVDLIAIGSGAAASGVAMKCRKAGWSVAGLPPRLCPSWTQEKIGIALDPIARK